MPGRFQINYIYTVLHFFKIAACNPRLTQDGSAVKKSMARYQCDELLRHEKVGEFGL